MCVIDDKLMLPVSTPKETYVTSLLKEKLYGTMKNP